jgi:FixJ family two-component response regulator
MPELEVVTLQKILHALLLIQMEEIDESNRFPILIRAGWTNAEIASSLGLSESAVAMRRTRLKQKTEKEKG